MEENVCRICLQTSAEEEMTSIYTSDEQGTIISNKIKSCCGVKQPKESDGFPTNICSKCKVFLTIAYKLRTICQNSDAYLRRFKLKEDIDTDENEPIVLKTEQTEVTELFKYCEDNTSKTSFPILKEEHLIDLDNGSDNEDPQFQCDEIPEIETDAKTSRDIGKIKSKAKTSMNKPETPKKLPKETKRKEKNVPQTNPTKYAICPYCGDKYTKSALGLHIRRHLGDKPYKCDMCDKAFVELYDLKRHKRTHTGERPHVCAVCGKAFSQANKLARHNLVHTGERPYKCDLCEKSFTQRNELNLHIRRHTGSKPYSCGICGASFLTGTFLRNHQRTMSHFEEEKEDRFVKIRVNSLSRSYRRKCASTM